MNKMILEIGAGKKSLKELQTEIYDQQNFAVYVDRGYKVCHPIQAIESDHKTCFLNWERNIPMSKIRYSDLDIFEFLDGYKYKFNKVIANRIFEHMEYCGGEIGRLLEALNMITESDGLLEIIVPNSVIIARMILDLENNIDIMSHTKLLNKLLIINTENQNIKCDPHASTWTPEIAKLYIESEGTWKVDSITDLDKYANRNIYMKIVCSKP